MTMRGGPSSTIAAYLGVRPVRRTTVSPSSCRWTFTSVSWPSAPAKPPPIPLAFECPHREITRGIAIADLDVDDLENCALPGLDILDAQRPRPPALGRHLPPSAPAGHLEELPLGIVEVRPGHLVVVLPNEEL